MKRILFVDYLSPEGHFPPTRAQMNSLHELGYDIYTVFRKGYYEDLGIKYAHKCIEIPNELYVGIGSHFKSRLSYIKILWFLKKNIKDQSWDYIILQGYEPFSLWLLPIFKNAFIVDHYTVSYLDNPIKRFPIKHLKKEYTHIVFNDLMRDALVNNGINRVFVVPLGMNMIGNVKSFNILSKLNLDHKKFIFSPSSTSSDRPLIRELCANGEFYNMLKKEGIKFVVKGPYELLEEKKDCIVVLREYLDSQDYDCLMKEAALVLIAYPSSFTYRVSGVQLECMASNIKCLLSDIPALRVYERFFNYKYAFFNNIQDLIQKIPMAVSEECRELYKDISEISSISNAWRTLLTK